MKNEIIRLSSVDPGLIIPDTEITDQFGGLIRFAVLDIDNAAVVITFGLFHGVILLGVIQPSVVFNQAFIVLGGGRGITAFPEFAEEILFLIDSPRLTPFILFRWCYDVHDIPVDFPGRYLVKIIETLCIIDTGNPVILNHEKRPRHQQLHQGGHFFRPLTG